MPELLESLVRRWRQARSRRRARGLVRRQRDSVDWPEVRATFDRLRDAGASEPSAAARVAAALEREIARMMAERRPFDRGAYVEDLQELR